MKCRTNIVKLAFAAVAMVFAFQLTALAQTKSSQILGNISDGNGEPLPGATVQIKGTNNGSSADLDGMFTISAKQGDVLVFSFVGFLSQEVKVGKSNVINVVLEEDTTLLEEAVSIGYGTQTRALLTTSITKVSSKEFEKSPQQNALAQLQGKVPGLNLQVTSGQPGSTADMFIRGGTTTAPNGDAPLIIVDGVISQGYRSIQDMNPADIESMEVLKDAASTAIYGAKAANGIIIVKTKSGQKGKAKVNFKYTFGVDQQPQRIDFLSARDYLYLTRSQIDKYATNSADRAKFLEGTFGMSTGNAWDSRNTTEFLDVYIQNYGAEFVADLIDNRGWQTMKDPVTGRQLIFQDNDFQDATYRTALKHDYDFSVSGGNDKASYYLSLRHLDQEGIIRGTWYKNYAINFNGQYRLSDQWKVNAKATLMVGDNSTVSSNVNSIQRAIFMPPTYRLYYEDGTPAPGEAMSSFRNHLYEIENLSRRNTNYRTGFQIGAEWNVFGIEGLTFAPTFYYTMTEGMSETFEKLNETTGTEIRKATAAHQYDGHIQADLLLSYNKKIQKNNISAVAGATYTRDNEFALSGSGSGAATDLIPTLNATADSTQRITSTRTQEAILSYFGRVSYSYDDKYIASVSLRADGSSRFADNHKWGFFPGASVGWNMHKEEFFEPVKNVWNKFKVRGSWGRAGNNSISIANSQGQYSITGTTYLNETGILNTTLKNADLVWETTESFDVGVDFGFLKDRIGLVVDLYSKKTFNRLYDNKLWASTGFSSIKCNYGTLGTKGIEVELKTTPISTKDFSWNLNANFSWYRSIVLELPDNGEDKNRTGGNYVYDPVTGTEVKVGGFAEGERFAGRWAYHYLGVYQSDEEAALAPYDVAANGRTKVAGDAIFEDRNNDGQIDVKDMVFMGYIRPDIQGGITNEFRWKNFSARIVMDYALGHVICNGFKAYALGSFRNNCNTITDALTNCWTSENPNAYYPRFTPQSDSDYTTKNFMRNENSIGGGGTGQPSNSAFYHKGDYLAFREVSLSYNIPEKLLNKAKIASLQVFAGVYNIGYITEYDGMTPEIYNGYDYGIYPRPREFSFGVNLGF